ncbi:hypothetical protein DICVIV_13638 [Dictyocaulus viviparus]|uniref:Uncharacterized protein n=1 Tax=Dictyocaulus viviparus TaxID=29172 RepID=A0A0D8X9F6_DICVI|nr:hypothetical protein DICVIV_13638 [Dictyocaulus viviparus]
MDMKTNCNVVSNTVSSICTMMACDITMNMNIASIPSQHFTITGTLRITNLIMAGWSDQM